VITAAHVTMAKRAANGFARHLPTSVDRDDLAQVALIAVHEHLPRFDAARGVPLSAYLNTKMRGAMLDELRRMDMLPRGDRRQLSQAAEARRRLEHHLGRAAREGEVAAALGVPLLELQKLRGAGAALAVDEVGPDLTEDMVEARLMFDRLQQAFDALSEREQTMLAPRLAAGGATDQRTAALAGLSPGRVSQICTGALDKLRRAVGIEPTSVPRGGRPMVSDC